MGAGQVLESMRVELFELWTVCEIFTQISPTNGMFGLKCQKFQGKLFNYLKMIFMYRVPYIFILAIRYFCRLFNLSERRSLQHVLLVGIAAWLTWDIVFQLSFWRILLKEKMQHLKNCKSVYIIACHGIHNFYKQPDFGFRDEVAMIFKGKRFTTHIKYLKGANFCWNSYLRCADLRFFADLWLEGKFEPFC